MTSYWICGGNRPATPDEPAGLRKIRPFELKRRRVEALARSAMPPLPMELESHRRNWEDLSELDPYWAILSDPSKRFGGWDLGDFFESGRAEVDGLMSRTGALGRPLERRQALDFGCGVGRLTRALSTYFDRCVGIDISEQMVATAREVNRDVHNCQFAVNNGSDLRSWQAESFDLVYTQLVLQHLPGRAAILRCLEELVRLVRPGGLLVFQLPSYIPALRRLQPRPRLYRLLRGLGVPAAVLYRRLRLQPISMRAVSVEVATSHLAALGLVVLESETVSVEGGVRSTTYFATPERLPSRT